MRQQLLPIAPKEILSFQNFFINQENLPVIHYLKNLDNNNNLQAERIIYLTGKYHSGLTHVLKACNNYYAETKNYFFSFSEMAKNKNTIKKDFIELAGLLSELSEKKIIILLDDVDSIAGDADLEKALFNLYNNIQQSQIQNYSQHYLIMASHIKPLQSTFKLADLKSRLQALLLLTLKELSDTDKLQALIMRANLRGFELSQEVGEYLLNHYPRDTYYLFESLEKLDTLSLEEKRKLTIPFVKKIL